MAMEIIFTHTIICFQVKALLKLHILKIHPDIVFISVTIARYLFNAKLIARELSKGLPDSKIFLGGLGTQGMVDGELQEISSYSYNCRYY